MMAPTESETSNRRKIHDPNHVKLQLEIKFPEEKDLTDEIKSK